MVSTMTAMGSLDAAFQGASDPTAIGLEALNLVTGSQKFLKKSVNAILPIMLLLGGVGTIIHRSITYEGYFPDRLRPFLFMVLAQLFPMAALKLKTCVCSDLTSLMPAALAKTLMMHIAVQVFRLNYSLYTYAMGVNAPSDMSQQCFDVISFLVALYILFKEFDFKLGSLAGKEHSDVLTTIAGGCVVAVLVNIIAPIYFHGGTLRWILSDLGNWVEVLAFVPVARIVCLEIGVETAGTNVGQSDRRKLMVCMAFIVAFYFWDDIFFPASLSEAPLVTAGKAAHFVMLLDFAGYFILRVGAPSKIAEDILPKFMPEAILKDDLNEFQTDEKKGLLCEEDEEDGLQFD